MKKISHAFSQAPFLEGTAADEEWREKANLPMPEKKQEEDSKEAEGVRALPPGEKENDANNEDIY